MTSAELLRQKFSLGSLANAGGAQQDESPRVRYIRGHHLALESRALQPGGAVTFGFHNLNSF